MIGWKLTPRATFLMLATERGIYCDGHSETIPESVALKLNAAGILIPHPGRGTEDVEADAFTLAAGMEWSDVYAVARS